MQESGAAIKVPNGSVRPRPLAGLGFRIARSPLEMGGPLIFGRKLKTSVED